MATARANSESLLLYDDAVLASLKKHEKKNNRAQLLLQLFERRGELLIELSIVCIVWSAFCGPLLRVAEQKQATVSQVRNEMKMSESEATTIMQSNKPYDTMLAIATKKAKHSKYYR
jgi:hypothetical protein